MRNRSPELKSMQDFSKFRRALGEVSGYPSEETLKRNARRERIREIGLAVIDIALQPIVEVKAARAEAESTKELESEQLSISAIRELSDQGVGVVIHPFKN